MIAGFKGERVLPALTRLAELEAQARQAGNTALAETAAQTLAEVNDLLFSTGDISHNFGYVTDITEQRRSQSVHEALYQISTAVITAADLNELFTDIHAILRRLLPANNFFIALYDPAEDLIHFPYYVDEYDAPPGSKKPHRGLTEYVLRTGQTLLASPELFADLVTRGEVILDGSPSVDWLGVPLKLEGNTLGVMAVQSYTQSLRLGKNEVQMMEFVSSQIAQAIERRRALDEMHRRLEELTVLHSVASFSVEAASEDDLIELATRLIGESLFTDNFGLMMLDEQTQTLVMHPSYHRSEGVYCPPVPLGQGITGLVALTGQSYRSSDVTLEPMYIDARPGTCSELCAPLKVGNRVIGVVNSESYQPDAFTDADQRLLETIAGQVATAIEKLRLLSHSQHGLMRLNALRMIDMSINGNVDLQVTLNVVLTQTIQQLAVDAADIYLYNPHTHLLELAVFSGFRTSQYQRASIRLNDGRAGRIALDRIPLYLPDNTVGNEASDSTLKPPGEDFATYFGVPIIAKGQTRGLLEVFHRRPFHPESEWVNFLGALAGQAAIAIDNAGLFDALQRSNQELMVAYNATLEGWAHALELRDRETKGHSQRVTDLTLRLARAMNVSDPELDHIRRGALMHDIGKMGIPDSILQKTGPLTKEEWEVMHRHPIYAFDMLFPISYMRPSLDIPYRHHEKWDGSGYPARLKGEQIPLAARIFAVVDVWDALTSDRPYRSAWTKPQALDYIRQQAGTHFDPHVAAMFLQLIETGELQ